MNIFEKIAEERIREAMENGEFDNLPTAGKPVDLSAYFNTPGHLRMAYDLLKNAGVLPTEVELRKNISQLKSQLKSITDIAEKNKLEKKIQFKEIELNIVMEKFHKKKI